MRAGFREGPLHLIHLVVCGGGQWLVDDGQHCSKNGVHRSTLGVEVESECFQPGELDKVSRNSRQSAGI